jgi:hypothetical protein
MYKIKQRKLEAVGWRVGSAAEFVELSPEEAALVETKLALSTALRARRTAHHLSQAALAKRLKSSQSPDREDGSRRPDRVRRPLAPRAFCSGRHPSRRSEGHPASAPDCGCLTIAHQLRAIELARAQTFVPQHSHGILCPSGGLRCPARRLHARVRRQPAHGHVPRSRYQISVSASGGPRAITANAIHQFR